MIRIIQKRWITGIFSMVVAIVTTISMFTYFYTDKIISQFQPTIMSFISKKTNLNISFSHIEGNLHKGFIVSDISFKSGNEKFLDVESMYLNFRVSQLIYKKIHFDDLTVDSGILNIQVFSEMKNSVNDNSGSDKSNWSTDLDYCNLKKFKIQNLDENYLVSSEFEIQHSKAQSRINIHHVNVTTDKLAAHAENIPLKLENYTITAEQFLYNIAGSDSVSGHLSFAIESNQWGFPVDFNIEGNASTAKEMVNDIQLGGAIFSDKLKLQRGSLTLDQADIEFSGQYFFDDERWALNIVLDEFTSELDSVSLVVTGNINTTGSGLKNKILIETDISNLNYGMYDLGSIRGELFWMDSTLMNINPIEIEFSGMTGLIDSIYVKNKNYRVEGDIAIKDFVPAKYISGLPNISLTGIGSISVANNSGSLNLMSKLFLKPISYKNLHLGDSFWETTMSSEDGSVNTLNLNGKANSLDFPLLNLDNTVINASYSNESIRLNNIYGYSKNGDFVFLSGFTDSSMSNFILDSLFLNLNGVSSYSNNLDVIKQQDFFKINCEALFLNNGKISISGKYANEEKYEFNVGFNDVNIPDVLKMIRKNYQLSGKIFGETQVSKWNSKPILFSDIRIFDGQIGDFSAHQLSGKVSFFDNRWLISGINTKSELGNVELSGWINSSVDSAKSIVFLPDDSLSIKTTFQDFQIESIKEIIPWDFETDGKLSGDLHITGQLSNYDLESDIVILNPVFDQINGKEARGQIIYNDKKLYFKETQLDMNSGKYFISGFIPVDLDYFSFDRSKVFENPMDLMISGKTEELEFFYPYFDIIDSLICDCSLQLSLEGPFKEPVRNGQAVISDGKVNITPLNNSFTEIDGLITIDDNQLIISKLEGKSYNPESEDILKTPLDYLSKIFHIAQESEQKPKNIEVSGTMDLTEFFHPNFNVSAKGKNIFIEDSQDEFSGSGLADIFISGKDTIFISGTFEPDPYEFTISPVMTSESTLSKVYETGGIHILYDLHIPLDNGVIIKNEFMEIEIEGEITLTAIDEEEFVLSGSIDIVEGSFFLNGNEFSETEGRILFDPGSDYPTVDIFAYTFIAGQAYKVFFSGPLNNPVIGFESEDPTDPYSQDEILRILLAGDESLVAGNDFKIQDAGTNILSNYLESELERLITARSPVDKFQLKSQGALFRDINNMNVNLYVGKRMSRKLYMNVKSDIFSDQIKNEYEITYRMDKNQSIVVRLDEEGFPHLNYRVKYKY